jgi:hypothetical protein
MVAYAFPSCVVGQPAGTPELAAGVASYKCLLLFETPLDPASELGARMLA